MGEKTLDTTNRDDANKLNFTLHQSKRRRKWRSSVINFESNRSIQKITPFQFSWEFIDPLEEEIKWDSTFTPLRDRFRDTQHSIFKMVQNLRNKIAKKAEQLRNKGENSMPLDWKNPIEPFKIAFSQLLSPKELIYPDPKKQQLTVVVRI